MHEGYSESSRLFPITTFCINFVSCTFAPFHNNNSHKTRKKPDPGERPSDYCVRSSQPTESVNGNVRKDKQVSERERERETEWERKSERARETKSATLSNLALSPSLSLHFLFLKMFPYFTPFSPSLFLSLGNSFYCSVSLQQPFYYILSFSNSLYICLFVQQSFCFLISSTGFLFLYFT